MAEKRENNFKSFLQSYQVARKEMSSYSQVRVATLNIISLAKLKGQPFDFASEFAKSVLPNGEAPSDLPVTKTGKYCIYFCLLYIRRRFITARKKRAGELKDKDK